MKKLKLSSNFVDLKQIIIAAGDYFNEELFFAMSIEGISQRETSDFLVRATSATSNQPILQRVTSDFCNEELLQRVTSEFSNEQQVIFLQQVKSDFCNEELLQRVTSDILQRGTSATSNE